MKLKIKTKVVIRFILIYWVCFFVLWFLLKKLPEIKNENFSRNTFYNAFVKNEKDIINKFHYY